MIPLRDNQPPSGFAGWVVILILVNICIFYLELASVSPDAFISQYALIPANIDFAGLQGLKPFITSQFIHGGFLHIISNMLFLWIFGGNVEAKLGIFFPLFYLLGGIIAAFTQYLLIPTSNIPMLGASGAIAAVLGAYFVFFSHHKIKTLVPLFGFFTILDIPASIMLFYWFFTQLFSGVATIVTNQLNLGGVAFFAHIGGFVYGMVAGSVIRTLSTPARRLLHRF